MQDLAVAPDGSSVVYGRRDHRRRRAIASPCGAPRSRAGRPERITAPDASATRPRFAPDGSALLFLSDRSGRSQPWVLPLSGGEPRLLADVPGDVAAAEWSPDGRTVALLAPERRAAVRRRDARRPRRAAHRRLHVAVRRRGVPGPVHEPVDGPGVRRAGRLAGPRRRTTSLWSSGTQAARASASWRTSSPASWRRRPACGPSRRAAGRPRRRRRSRAPSSRRRWGPSGVLAFIGNPRAGAWSSTTELFVAEGDEVRQLGGRARRVDRVHELRRPGRRRGVRAPSFPCWLDERTLVAPVSRRGGTQLYAFGLGRGGRAADDRGRCRRHRGRRRRRADRGGRLRRRARRRSTRSRTGRSVR